VNNNQQVRGTDPLILIHLHSRPKRHEILKALPSRLTRISIHIDEPIPSPQVTVNALDRLNVSLPPLHIAKQEVHLKEAKEGENKAEADSKIQSAMSIFVMVEATRSSASIVMYLEEVFEVRICVAADSRHRFRPLCR